LLSSEPLVVRSKALGISYRLGGHTSPRTGRYVTMTVLDPFGADSDRTAMLAVVPELARDVMPDGTYRFDSCDLCNYDRHDCPGCGTPLSHNGLERTAQGWLPHAGCTD
jgi:hypothetical protein